MTATRTAWHIPRYGRPDILTPVTLPMPEPAPTEVLIRIRASAVTRADGMMRKGEPLFARPFLGLRRPRNGLAGTGLSGEVIAVGDKPSRQAACDVQHETRRHADSKTGTHITTTEAMNVVGQRALIGVYHGLHASDCSFCTPFMASARLRHSFLREL